MKARSRIRGYYRRSERITGLFLFAVITTTSALTALFGGIDRHNDFIMSQLQTPYVKEVFAKEEVKSIIQLTQEEQVKEYISQVFGDKAEEALKIAKCESQYDPQRIGDKHLMSINNQTGELVGDSIGIFQVRTGDTTWNRAKANGLTADEFRTKLKDFKYNIDYAKTIYDKAGDWSPWLNCMNKVLN